MATYTLKIMTPMGTETMPLSADSTVTLQATPKTQYQIIDEQGNVVAEQDLVQQTIDQNLQLSLGESSQPNLIIEDYFNYTAATNSANATLALSEKAVVAEQVLGASNFATMATIAGSAVALAGGIAVLAGSKGKGESTPAPTPVQPTQPEKPNKPAEPEAQNKPTQPEMQSKPAEPEAQNKPTQPETQSKPAEPEAQNKPTQPETQSKPAEPEAQNKPTQSETQSKPAEPEAQNKPTQSETPSNPAQPEEPELPVEQDIQISLDQITGDDLINVTEAKQEIEVMGKISGADATPNSVVTLSLNGKTYTATVNSDLSFKAVVNGADLAQTPNYQLSATVVGNNNATATANRPYTVSPDVAAQIDITNINGNFAPTSGEITRISGSIELAGLFAVGKNPLFVRSAVLKIGEKSYSIGIRNDDQTFYADIPTNELLSLNGQAMTIEMPYTAMAFTLTPKKNRKGEIISYAMGRKYEAPIELASSQFDAEYSIKNGTQYQLKIENPTSEIRGVVSGSAKEGDEVVVSVGGEQFSTKVNADRSFSLQVNADLLKGTGNQSVQAVLKTQDLAGNVISVSDRETVLNSPTSSSEFVSPTTRIDPKGRHWDHTSDDYNFPYFIHGLEQALPTGYHAKIPVGGKIGETPTVKYYFVTQDDIDNGRYGSKPAQTREYSDELKAVVRKAYALLSENANINFEETTNGAEAGTRLTSQHWQGSVVAMGATGGAVSWDSRSTPAGKKIPVTKSTTYSLNVALHEIGHTLNMKHPFGTGSGKQESYEAMGNVAEKYNEFTNLAYTDLTGGGESLKRENLYAHDLAFLHYRLGVNPNQRAGNDVYSFKNYNFQANDGDRYIWDGAGLDTFDASMEKEGVNVNLTPGSWISYRSQEKLKNLFVVEDNPTFTKAEFLGLSETDVINGGPNGNITETNIYTKGQAFIGYGTQIENLIGSDYDDILTGNNADNAIYGGAGNDVIKGGLGNDYLDGGEGADTLEGGVGNDSYVVDNAGDVVTELANEGTDTVFALIDYRLGNHLENLTLFGSTSLTGTGNELDNVVSANNAGNTLQGLGGNDRLIGGLGADTLTGGEGRDIFVFNTALNGKVDAITDFTPGEDKIELASTIFVGVTTANFDDYIKYDSASGKLSYDPDGTGAADPIHFATLSTGLNLTSNDFIIG